MFCWELHALLLLIVRFLHQLYHNYQHNTGHFLIYIAVMLYSRMISSIRLFNHRKIIKMGVASISCIHAVECRVYITHGIAWKNPFSISSCCKFVGKTFLPKLFTSMPKVDIKELAETLSKEVLKIQRTPKISRYSYTALWKLLL